MLGRDQEATDIFYSKYRFSSRHPHLTDAVFPVGLSVEGESPSIGRYLSFLFRSYDQIDIGGQDYHNGHERCFVVNGSNCTLYN